MPPQFENNTQPESASAQQPRHKHTRLVLLAIGMILIGIMAVGYFWYQKEFQTNMDAEEGKAQLGIPIDVKLPPINEFTDWQTYTNEKSGFTIKYPEGWIMSGNEKEPWVFQSTDFSNNVHGIGLPPIGNMRINIAGGYDPCKDYDTGFVNQNVELGVDISERVICRNNFQVTLDLWNKDPKFNEHKNLLDKILSTFKFISTSTPTQ